MADLCVLSQKDAYKKSSSVLLSIERALIEQPDKPFHPLALDSPEETWWPLLRAFLAGNLRLNISLLLVGNNK